jgi:hypothetical protein
VTIIEGLRSLAVPVVNVEYLPDNARRGDVDRVARSLNAFGQRKPIVCRRTGVDVQGRPTGIIIAGNHTYRAAVEKLGWSEIAAVWTDDDNMTARAYGLADNRTGEVATWDLELLASELAELTRAEFPHIAALGWDPHELEPLLSAEWTPPTPEGSLDDFSQAEKAITLRFTPEQMEIVGRAITAVREAVGDVNISEGRALELVCADYLAGA